MKLDVRTLTLLGVLALVAVLGIGVAAIGLPMYERVQAAEAQISDAEANNAAFQAQLAGLAAAKQRRAEIETHLTQLRSALPDTQDTASVVEAIDIALVKHGAQPGNFKVLDQTAYVPRPAAGEETTPPAPPAPDPAAEDSATEGPTTEDQGVQDSAGTAALEQLQDPRQQYVVEFEVVIADATTAAAFLDTLRAYPRQLLITHADVEPFKSNDTPNLKVTMTAFTRLEDAA